MAIKRFGNGVLKEVDIPPTDEMPELWPRVRILAAGVYRVSAARASAMLRMPISTWIDESTTHLSQVCCALLLVARTALRSMMRMVWQVAGVWGTVTGRERLWYTFFFDSCVVAQPCMLDGPQHIGAGAMRGFCWHLHASVTGFDRKENHVTQEQARDARCH